MSGREGRKEGGGVGGGKTEEGGIEEEGGVTPNVVGERRKWMKREEICWLSAVHTVIVISFPPAESSVPSWVS